jgi:deoxyribodipyrimidine photo-lyase
MSETTILWLRRDLRLDDHAALALTLSRSGQIQPIFVFDTDILQRFTNPHDRRLTFIADTLTALHHALQARGGGLLILHGRAEELIPKLATLMAASAIVAAEDYEPATRARDQQVEQAVAPLPFLQVKDHVLAAPTEILREGKAYKVYTPYANAWRKEFSQQAGMPYIYDDQGRYANYPAVLQKIQEAGLNVIDPNHILAKIGYQRVELGIWLVAGARERLGKFIATQVVAYDQARDYMDRDGTSQLSPYLRFGLLSIRECYRLAAAIPGTERWISELIWRDFYAMILYHYQESVTTEWNPLYRNKLPWSHDPVLFKAWQEGKTGYPIVDAAMRQLLTTGWMHNRARMIVASFLTKHLQIDWRLGEEHFAQHLMDYDLASNVGGWQWAASTGTDAQPYFRVFNPTLQSKKFDPDGNYIRKYVPKLREMEGDAIHTPPPLLYYVPIVDHATARRQAIRMFQLEG